jgi:uncharacterized protein (TIGR02145 family)
MYFRKILRTTSFALTLLGSILILPSIRTCQKFPDSFFFMTTDSVYLYNDYLRAYRFEGTIVNMGRLEVSDFGFCWSQTDPPTLSDEFTDHYSKYIAGSFTDNVYDLQDSSIYYVRAYAETNDGIKYGKTKILATYIPSSEPVVTTGSVTDITINSAKVAGEVIRDGGEEVTRRGLCYGKMPYPTLDDDWIDGGDGTGAFTSSLSDLEFNTTYFLRAFATNSEGTGYGNQVHFRTLSTGPVITDYDGNIYNTVFIGRQLWMAENLRSIHFADGSPIPLVQENTAWNALGESGKAYCWYEDNDPIGIVFGNLYTWNAALNGATPSELNPSGIQGVCPDGWHLPSDGEWKDLEIHLGMSPDDADIFYGDRGTDEGGKLKVSDEEYWASPNTDATNESRFTALASGYRLQNGTYNGFGYITIFWTATRRDADEGLARYLQYDSPMVLNGAWHNNFGLSVRCVKDWSSPSLPSVMTTAISNVTETGAETGGTVSDDGGAAVTAYGVCWSISPDPTLENDHTTDGAGTGSFISNLTGLECNTLYYVRAYATNSAGTAYGSNESFTTAPCPVNTPSITTLGIINITGSTAQGGGNVTNEGGSAVTARGVCWSTSQNPTTDDQKTTDGTGTGSFTSLLSGLSPSTTYYVRAYATNTEGTAYGDQESFITLSSDTTITDIDGNSYKTKQIGDQVWMTENLTVTHYADGSNLTDGTGAGAITGDQTTKYYFIHGDLGSREEIYGRLYTWAAVMDGDAGSDAMPSGIQGVCPDGWHIPSDSEWKVLEQHLGMSASDASNWNWRGTVQGTSLKEGGESGFEGLLGGYRNHNGNYYDLGIYGYFWSTTDDGSNAYIRQLGATSSQVRRTGLDKSNACSARCLKD